MFEDKNRKQRKNCALSEAPRCPSDKHSWKTNAAQCNDDGKSKHPSEKHVSLPLLAPQSHANCPGIEPRPPRDRPATPRLSQRTAACEIHIRWLIFKNAVHLQYKTKNLLFTVTITLLCLVFQQVNTVQPCQTELLHWALRTSKCEGFLTIAILQNEELNCATVNVL